MAVFYCSKKKAKHKHARKNRQSKQKTDDARTETEEEESVTVAEVIKARPTHDLIKLASYKCNKKHSCFNCDVYKQEDNADYWKENQQ